MKKETGYLNLLVWLLVLAGYLALAPSAHAHVQQGQAVSFMTGLEHPWSGLDHVLAMIAVGLWGAQLGNPAIWALPITFPLVMSLGAMMGLIGIPLPGIEIGIAVSAIVLGLMVLGEVRPKLIVAAILVGCFAVFHGHAHGTELPAGQNCHRLSARHWYRYRFDPPLALGQAGASWLRSINSGNGTFFSVAGGIMMKITHTLKTFLSFSVLVVLTDFLFPFDAAAHLVTTGMGPVYDGIGHLLLTPEDLVPVIAVALLAGLRGKIPGRRALFFLPVAWLAGGFAGLMASSEPIVAMPALSFLILGGLIAADLHLPDNVTTLLLAGHSCWAHARLL
jgi:urease accessory protein